MSFTIRTAIALMVVMLMNAGTVYGQCCDIRGDIDHSGVGPDIADLVYMVTYMFQSGPEPPCIEEADIDGNGSDPDIADLVYLVTYMFQGGPDPVPCPGPGPCPDSPTVKDIDGNVYQTVLIGDQCWMMENLKVTHYRNGDPIPHVTDGGTWSGLTTGAYCAYDNDESNVATYGRLYNWYAVDDSRNIAPEGWHVPTDGEWQTLVDYLGGAAVAGGKLKEAGTAHWSPPNEGATNESGFTALPGGSRDGSGGFDDMGGSATFWSSSEYYSNLAWTRTLSCNNSHVYRLFNYKHYGFSVRCVRDY